jgi:hypothetical protein
MGMVVDPDDGAIFLADKNNQRISRSSRQGASRRRRRFGDAGDGGAVSRAPEQPRGLALDADKFVHLDANNQTARGLRGDRRHRAVRGRRLHGQRQLRRAARASGANLNNPGSLVVDGEGSVFIVDEGHQRVRSAARSRQPRRPGEISTEMFAQLHGEPVPAR